MNASNKIIRATVVVFGFWWLILTAWAFGGSPLMFIDNWAFVGFTITHWVLGVVSGLIIGIWFIWFARITAMNRLYKGKGGTDHNGARSTLGAVPVPVKALKRVESESKRLPIENEKILSWLENNQKAWPAHVKLFWAIWDTYSAYSHFPASHRRGGHGNRRLWQHCLAVTATALQDAPAYVFEGVYVKARGKPKFKIIDLKNKEYVFDSTDPLIPILALAHDIGKLEAYVLAADGSVITKEEGGALTPQDDNRISHDALGSRILARFPEHWPLPPRDRTTVNLVIAHYHHPSRFPVDRNGLSLDDRMTALMEFLILADKKTGMAESSITETLTEQEISEEESSSIYHCFVDIITEFGRVNGTGDQARDSTLKIAQKHDGLIVIKEKDLRMLVLAKMGWSLEEGDGRYRMTLNLVTTLQEKGVLYSAHNQADMSRFFPMYSVAFRNPQTGAHLTTWEPCIIIRPVATTPELAALSGLPNMTTKLDIERPLFTHNLGITETDTLRALIARGFGDEIAGKATIAGKQIAKRSADPVVAVASPDPAPAPASNEPNVAVPVAQVTSSTLLSSADTPIVPVPEFAPAPAPTIPLAPESPPSPDPVPPSDQVVPADEQTDSFNDDDLLDDDLQALSAEVNRTEDQIDESDEFSPFSGETASNALDDAFDGFEEGLDIGAGSTMPYQLPADSSVSIRDPKASDLTAPESPKPIAIAIPDPDAQPIRKKSQAAEAAALRALEQATQDFTAFAPLRKKKKSINQMERIRKAVDAHEIPICGTRDGFDYLLESDMKLFDENLDVNALIKSEKLPTVEAKPGCLMVGVPVAPLVLDL